MRQCLGNDLNLSASPSLWDGNPNPSVEQVSYNDSLRFIERLNDSEENNLPAGWKYILPTEAEWEYACEAGTSTLFSWGDDASESLVNYNKNLGQTSDVGNYAPNFWGFYDMHGNVWEWVSDWFGAFSSENVTDPFSPIDGTLKVRKGGSVLV